MIKAQVEQNFTSYVESLNVEAILKEAMLYSFIAEGKMIRSQILVAALMDLGVEYPKYINVATAIEMIHTYSLVHDDLPSMDNDDFRRGKLSCHKQFGENIAILVGDALLTESINMVLMLESENSKLQLLSLIVNAAGINRGMINGQTKDILNENNQDITFEELKEIYNQKTGRLIALPFECALTIANHQDDDAIAAINNLGLLYQIQDDYLDKYGENIGKTIGKDESLQKITFNSFYEKKELEALMEQLFEQLYTQLKNYPQVLAIIKKIDQREK